MYAGTEMQNFHLSLFVIQYQYLRKVKCPNNSSSCNPQDPRKCLSCDSNIYQLIDSECKMITNEVCYFQTTKDVNKCLLCKIDYRLHPDGHCVRCISSCKYSCNAYNISQCKNTKNFDDILTSLEFLYQLEGCRHNFNNQCYLALPGYRIETVDGKFVARYACLKPCVVCDLGQIDAILVQMDIR